MNKLGRNPARITLALGTFAGVPRRHCHHLSRLTQGSLHALLLCPGITYMHVEWPSLTRRASWLNTYGHDDVRRAGARPCLDACQPRKRAGNKEDPVTTIGARAGVTTTGREPEPVRQERHRPRPGAQRVRRLQPGLLGRADPGRDHPGNGVHAHVLAAREHAAVVPAGHPPGGHLRPGLPLLHGDHAAVRRGLRLGVQDAQPVLRLLREFLAHVRVPHLDRVQLHLHAVGDGPGGRVRGRLAFDRAHRAEQRRDDADRDGADGAVHDPDDLRGARRRPLHAGHLRDRVGRA